MSANVRGERGAQPNPGAWGCSRPRFWPNSGSRPARGGPCLTFRRASVAAAPPDCPCPKGVRLRHRLSEQRSEWQQRIQATLYHHGCPQRRSLLIGDGREWLAAQPLPAAAREQVTVALAMIDGIEVQIAPLDKELRAYAQRQSGSKALMAHYGIGPLIAVRILAELGDCTRFSSSRLAIRYAVMDITMTPVRSASCTGAPLASGSAGAALGAVRGGPVRLPAGQPRRGNQSDGSSVAALGGRAEERRAQRRPSAIRPSGKRSGRADGFLLSQRAAAIVLG